MDFGSLPHFDRDTGGCGRGKHGRRLWGRVTGRAFALAIATNILGGLLLTGGVGVAWWVFLPGLAIALCGPHSNTGGLVVLVCGNLAVWWLVWAVVLRFGWVNARPGHADRRIMPPAASRLV